MKFEDGAWQFLSDDEFDIWDVARIVGFQEILNIDPSLIQLLEMKPVLQRLEPANCNGTSEKADEKNTSFFLIKGININ